MTGPREIHSNFPLPPPSRRAVKAARETALRHMLRLAKKRTKYQRYCDEIEARKAALEIIEEVCGKGVRARLDRYMPALK